MKKVLMGFTVVLMALAVQAQMGGSVEKTIAGLEQQWAASSKASSTPS